MREVISAALAGAEQAKLAAQLESLSGREYIDAYVKLAEFITPKLQRTAVGAGNGIHLTGVQLVNFDGSPLSEPC